MTASPLTRSRDERMLAGVCAGLAAHLGMPVGAVRAAAARAPKVAASDRVVPRAASAAT